MSLPELVKFTYRTEGIRGFYRGFTFTFFSSLPASCLYFSSQEYSRKYLFSNSLMSGFFAEAVACSIYTPIDVIKERLQASNATEHTVYNSGGVRALKHIVQTQGVGGLYKGYFVTLCSFGPFSALYFSFYEAFRQVADRKYEGVIPAHAFWLGAGASGAAAAWITTPLDLVKLRMQLDPASSFFLGGKWIDNFKQMYAGVGLRGMFRGASTRVLYFAPSTAFSMMIFEKLKTVL